jgi:transposase
MKSTAFIGVDVSQTTLDIALDGETQVQRIDNTPAGVRRWLRTVPQPAHIGVESTASLHQLLVREAIRAGHVVYVLNARNLSNYARSLGRRAKTDRLDALLIARYLRNEHPDLHPYVLPTDLQKQIDELIRRRHKVVVTQGALRASLQSASLRLNATRPMMAAFKSMLAEIDRRLQSLVQQDARLADHARRLKDVVGFGPLLSAGLAHAITRHPYKNDDAFIASIGLDPRARDSGQLHGRRYLSKHGPAELRRLVFLAAMAACKTKLWNPFYQRYRTRGFSSTAALVILGRKLARLAFSIVKHQTDFDPGRVNIACGKP